MIQKITYFKNNPDGTIVKVKEEEVVVDVDTIITDKEQQLLDLYAELESLRSSISGGTQ